MQRPSVPPAQLAKEAFTRARQTLATIPDLRDMTEVEKSLERSIDRLKNIPRKVRP